MKEILAQHGKEEEGEKHIDAAIDEAMGLLRMSNDNLRASGEGISPNADDQHIHEPKDELASHDASCDKCIEMQELSITVKPETEPVPTDTVSSPGEIPLSTLTSQEATPVTIISPKIDSKEAQAIAAMEERIREFLDSVITELDPNKFGCNLCGKFFMARIFVEKHMQLRHMEKLKDILRHSVCSSFFPILILLG